MPAARRATLTRWSRALADGEIDLGRAPTGTRPARSSAALPGIGPWTVETIAMRALGDPDAFLPTDLGVRAAAATLGLPATPAALIRRADALAALARLRRPAPLGDRRPPHQPAPRT